MKIAVKGGAGGLNTFNYAYNNRNSKGFFLPYCGGGLYIHQSTVSIQNSHFTSNQPCYQDAGGAITVRNGVLNVVGSIFSKNSGYQGGAIHMIQDSPNFIKQKVKSKNRNESSLNKRISGIFSGTQMFDNADVDIHDDDYIKTENTSFTGNQAFAQGRAIFLKDLVNAEGQLALIHGCIFYGNMGEQGAAIWADNTSISINKSRFDSNTALLYGGSFYFKKVQLIMVETELFNNSAGVYGSSMVTVASKANITEVVFIGNQKCEVLQSGAQLYILTSTIALTEVSLETTPQNCHPLTFDNFMFLATYSNAIEYDGFSMVCPQDYQAVVKTSLDGFQNDKDREVYRIDKSRLSFDFIFTCKIVPSGSYILGKSSLEVVSHTIKYHNNEIKPCPIPGGNCTHGLRPLDGFWGPFIKGGTAHFIKCAPELCCMGSECHGNTSCEEHNNRAGVLCTECKEGYSESMFSDQCVENAKCSMSLFIAVEIVLPIVIVSLSILLGGLKQVTKFYSFLKSMRHVRGGPEFTESIEGLAENDGPNEGGKYVFLLTFCIFQIAYYVQDATLYHVELPDNDIFLPEFLDAKFMRNIFSLHAQILSAFSKEACWKDIHPIGKILLNTSVYLCILLWFPLLYSVLFGVIPFCKTMCRCCSRPAQEGANSAQVAAYQSATLAQEGANAGVQVAAHQPARCCASIKIKRNFTVGFLTLSMLFYQGITQAALQMVQCVELDTPVLLIDANTKCYTNWWQYTIWIFIGGIYSVPLPLYIMFMPYALEKGFFGVTEFLLGLVLPGPLLFWALMKKLCRRLCGNLILIPPTAIVNGCECSKTDLRTILYEHLKGGHLFFLHNPITWEGVILALRMLLVFPSVLINDPLIRNLCMLGASMLNLAIHLSLVCYSLPKPVHLEEAAHMRGRHNNRGEVTDAQGHHNNLAPWIQNFLKAFTIICQFGVVAVGLCHVILATLMMNQYQPPESYPITRWLQIFINVFKVLLPIFCISMLLLISIGKLMWSCGRRYIK